MVPSMARRCERSSSPRRAASCDSTVASLARRSPAAGGGGLPDFLGTSGMPPESSAGAGVDLGLVEWLADPLGRHSRLRGVLEPSPMEVGPDVQVGQVADR